MAVALMTSSASDKFVTSWEDSEEMFPVLPCTLDEPPTQPRCWGPSPHPSIELTSRLSYAAAWEMVRAFLRSVPGVTLVEYRDRWVMSACVVFMYHATDVTVRVLAVNGAAVVELAFEDGDEAVHHNLFRHMVAALRVYVTNVRVREPRMLSIPPSPFGPIIPAPLPATQDGVQWLKLQLENLDEELDGGRDSPTSVMDEMTSKRAGHVGATLLGIARMSANPDTAVLLRGLGAINQCIPFLASKDVHVQRYAAALLANLAASASRWPLTEEERSMLAEQIPFLEGITARSRFEPTRLELCRARDVLSCEIARVHV